MWQRTARRSIAAAMAAAGWLEMKTGRGHMPHHALQGRRVCACMCSECHVLQGCDDNGGENLVQSSVYHFVFDGMSRLGCRARGGGDRLDNGSPS